MIRSIKYDSIRKIIVLCCNFFPFSSFLLKHILNNANIMNVLCFYKKIKKKDWERTRLSEEITTLNVTVTQHRDLAPFLFWALFSLRPYCSFLLCALFVLRTFCWALIVSALFAVPKCRGSPKMGQKKFCSQCIKLVFVVKNSKSKIFL